MSPGNPERLHGTLELLVLKLLEPGAMNGYAIGVRIQELTDGAVIVEEGSLYPALYRMQRRGWLKAVGQIGEQPPRQVLPTEPGREETARQRNGRVG